MPKWSKLEFTNDGKRILLGTKGTAHYILDSYNGQLINRLHRKAAPRTERETSGDCCFSPDGRYVVGGDGQKDLVVWDTFLRPEKGLSLYPVHSEEYGKDAAGVVVFNPRHALIATANKEVVSCLDSSGISNVLTDVGFLVAQYGAKLSTRFSKIVMVSQRGSIFTTLL
jgi:COMPASS component SWD2